MEGAMDSLHRYFDYSLRASHTPNTRQNARTNMSVLPYALLNLAVLHHRFGQLNHTEQALTLTLTLSCEIEALTVLASCRPSQRLYVWPSRTATILASSRLPPQKLFLKDSSGIPFRILLKESASTFPFP